MSRNSIDLATRIVRTVREHHLFKPGDRVIVALSGGADSAALLDMLSRLPGFPLRLVAAHLNHCLRGSESDADEEFSRTLAARYSIPFESCRIDVKALACQQGLNLEDAGRRARISFFEDIRRKWHATAVALAHHADDQSETVLMRLLRGAGPTGLAGMSYRNGRGFVRPILNITRTDIESYLTEQGLTYREDTSNQDTMFLRNRIRHELLPLLEQYNPAIRERLTTAATLLSDEDNLLDQIARNEFRRACVMQGNTLVCDIAMLTGHPISLRKRIFRKALERIAGNLDHFSSRHVTALERLMDSPRPNATLNLPQGITAVREYGNLQIRCGFLSKTDAMGELVITGPGHYLLPGAGHFTVAMGLASPDIASLPPDTAIFDLDKAPFPWLVRTFRDGDRIKPFGMDGSKKVKDIFIDSKIPLSQRRQTPLVFSNDTLIWICGLRTSQLARVDDTSSRIVTSIFSWIC